MTYDMKQPGMDDVTYERIVLGKKKSDGYFDLEKAITKLFFDFYNNICTNGVIYNHHTGEAISMIPMEVKDNYTNITYNDYVSRGEDDYAS